MQNLISEIQAETARLEMHLFLSAIVDAAYQAEADRIGSAMAADCNAAIIQTFNANCLHSLLTGIADAAAYRLRPEVMLADALRALALLRRGPRPVIGYGDEQNKAFAHGWSAKAERVWEAMPAHLCAAVAQADQD